MIARPAARAILSFPATPFVGVINAGENLLDGEIPVAHAFETPQHRLETAPHRAVGVERRVRKKGLDEVFHPGSSCSERPHTAEDKDSFGVRRLVAALVVKNR